RTGVTKVESMAEISLLEFFVREALNQTAARRMAVLNPLKVVIDNLSDGETLTLEAVNNPENPAEGSRALTLGNVFYIERDDFMMDPPKKFFRLSPGREVRLRYACLFTCTRAVCDDAGNVVELHGTYDPASKGGNAPDGRTVKGTIHWVDAATALRAPVRLYDRLFTVPDPLADETRDFIDFLNPDSLSTVEAFVEPSLAAASAGDRFQFERLGYFSADPKASAPNAPVFNRIVPLRDSWTK
ncbi:MAG: glutamine--tRNA ligase, partial [Kiritimatiellaeota bacterium]|nr:glutamine--tRNA ligase [Kiritimatiellota bacterium]